METLKERYLHLVKEKGVTPYEIAQYTGVSNSVLSAIKVGKTSKLSIENAKRLSFYFGVTKEWLTTGKGEMWDSGVMLEGVKGTSDMVSIFNETFKPIMKTTVEIAVKSAIRQKDEHIQLLLKTISNLEASNKDLRAENDRLLTLLEYERVVKKMPIHQSSTPISAPISTAQA